MNRLTTSLLAATLASAWGLPALAADATHAMPGATGTHMAAPASEKPTGAPKKHVAKPDTIKKHAAKKQAAHDKAS